MTMAGTQYYTCDTNPIDLETMLKSLFVQDTNGKVYFNIHAYTASTCPEGAIDCANSPMSLAALFQAAIEIDDCGNPALAAYTATSVPT